MWPAWIKISKRDVTILGVLAAVIIANGVAATALAGGNVYHLLFGDKGVIELMVSTATLVAAGITVYFLARRSDADAKQIELTRQSLDHARKAELASRYQKGVELLGGADETARIGGIFILRDVARDAPDLYHNPVVAILAKHIEARCEHLVGRADAYLDGIEIDDLLEVPSLQTPRDIRTALKVIGVQRLNPHLAELEKDTLSRNPLELQFLVLSGGYFDDINLSNFRFGRLIVQAAGLARCRFSDSVMNILAFPPAEELRPRSELDFMDCDFSGAIITLSTIGDLKTDLVFYECDFEKSKLFLRTNVHPMIADCCAEGLYVQTRPGNDVDLHSTWHWNVAPTIAPGVVETNSRLVDRSSPIGKTARGMPKYKTVG